MATRSNVKSFTSSSKKEALPPIVFELEGEEFEAYGQVPGAVLLDFVSASTDENGGGATAIMQYLKDSMNKANFNRFNKLVRDPDKLIELQVLADIVGYLVEQRTDSRPTE